MIDLKPEMGEIGKMFTLELERAVSKQIDLEGTHFWPVTWKTARARQAASNKIQREKRARGVKGRIPGTVAVRDTGLSHSKRLLFTRRFVHGAFRFAPFKDYVKIMTWPGTYPGEDVSFRDIVKYNNKGSSSVNPHITNPPKIFPINRDEVEAMGAFKQAVALLQSDRTIKKVVGREIKKKMAVYF